MIMSTTIQSNRSHHTKHFATSKSKSQRNKSNMSSRPSSPPANDGKEEKAVDVAPSPSLSTLSASPPPMEIVYQMPNVSKA